MLSHPLGGPVLPPREAKARKWPGLGESRKRTAHFKIGGPHGRPGHDSLESVSLIEIERSAWLGLAERRMAGPERARQETSRSCGILWLARFGS